MIEPAETVAELLKAWDEGDTIWSIELGGLGPGYEQAIQVLAVEISRTLQHYIPTGTKEEKAKAAQKIADETVARTDHDLGGLSGAQVNVATWLAFQWCHNGGPKRLIDRAKKKGQRDRVIQVSKAWPKAPEPVKP